MRILLTNNTLNNRAGSELYVRDLATALLKRGHTPIAFSTVLGDVARELRAATIPVIDNLEALTTPPDIIHGHHHLETMMALLHFPDTPAIYFCHGWLPWEEAAPRFPRILRYVAVDHTCRDRLAFEDGITESRIRVLLNFVDLERFKSRGPLPLRPKRALVFSNESDEQAHVRPIREACERLGIELDVIGLRSGKACAEPEKVLGEYDIVFAKARSAIEAMAVGAAVVLCGVTTMGPMVTTGELDRLRPLNFGIRALQKPISVEEIEREIERYDAEDAARVGERIRSTAALDSVVDDILSLYQEAISEFAMMPRNADDEQRAASDYLRSLAPRLKQSDGLKTEPEGLVSEIEQHEQKAKELIDKLQEQDQRILTLGNQLAQKHSELAGITNTLGWRLLSRYGPIKHRLLLPAYRRIQKLFSDRERS